MDSVGTDVDGRPWLLTVFPPAENVHLAKDVGMIPQYMASVGGYRSMLLCKDDGTAFPYALELTPNLEIVRIPLASGYRFALAPDPHILAWIKERASSIDVLQLFHATKETLRIALAYKLRNLSGVVYVKLDASSEYLDSLRIFGRGVSCRARMHNVFMHLFMAFVPKLVTAESNIVFAKAKALYPQLGRRLELLPNGIDDRWLATNGFSNVSPSDKENLIIVVGRIGAHQKNNDMLLEALHGIPDLESWSVVFIGPVEESFQSLFDTFLSEHPAMSGKVQLLGPIYDRATLYGWYRRAKVFCLTSRYESWCLALADALHFGCHIVSTPIASIPDITDSHSFGRIVHDADELRDEICSLIEGKTDPLASFDAIRHHAKGFHWSTLARRLAVGLGAHG